MRLIRHTDTSFGADDPDALAAFLHGRYELACVRPFRNEAYRLVSGSGGMIVVIYRNGTVLVQGRQADAAALLLADLCAQGGAT